MLYNHYLVLSSQQPWERGAILIPVLQMALCTTSMPQNSSASVVAKCIGSEREEDHWGKKRKDAKRPLESMKTRVLTGVTTPQGVERKGNVEEECKGIFHRPWNLISCRRWERASEDKMTNV